MREIPLGRSDKVALVDDEDYEWVTQWKWCAQQANRKGYKGVWYAKREPLAHERGPSVPSWIAMHVALMNPAGRLRVDHIDGDGFNNQRANLRLATHAQNLWNSRLSDRNKSGYKGVWYDKSRGKWDARLKANGKQIHLGRFATIEEAVEARTRAEIKYHGDFARTR